MRRHAPIVPARRRPARARGGRAAGKPFALTGWRDDGAGPSPAPFFSFAIPAVDLGSWRAVGAAATLAWGKKVPDDWPRSLTPLLVRRCDRVGTAPDLLRSIDMTYPERLQVIDDRRQRAFAIVRAREMRSVMPWAISLVGGALALWTAAVASPDLMAWLTELFIFRIR